MTDDRTTTRMEQRLPKIVNCSGAKAEGSLELVTRTTPRRTALAPLRCSCRRGFVTLPCTMPPASTVFSVIQLVDCTACRTAHANGLEATPQECLLNSNKLQPGSRAEMYPRCGSKEESILLEAVSAHHRTQQAKLALVDPEHQVLPHQ